MCGPDYMCLGTFTREGAGVAVVQFSTLQDSHKTTIATGGVWNLSGTTLRFLQSLLGALRDAQAKHAARVVI